jgi:hypothetical protein
MFEVILQLYSSSTQANKAQKFKAINYTFKGTEINLRNKQSFSLGKALKPFFNQIVMDIIKGIGFHR